MSQYNLERIFEPRRVAVVGASEKSGGIGNAWDFFDYQRVFNASSRWSLLVGAHTLQAGVEYRHINLEGEYMSRTNGDLDYGNWALFFTGNGAAAQHFEPVQAVVGADPGVWRGECDVAELQHRQAVFLELDVARAAG